MIHHLFLKLPSSVGVAVRVRSRWLHECLRVLLIMELGKFHWCGGIRSIATSPTRKVVTHCSKLFTWLKSL